ncbi:hypothetical protein [Haladaptatus sp. CMAA 1911]|uniref:hypothetical protein n=1 Tax=unclassified Haladaptatus TaxID=2622732 RepID=UPI00375439FF
MKARPKALLPDGATRRPVVGPLAPESLRSSVLSFTPFTRTSLAEGGRVTTAD